MNCQTIPNVPYRVETTTGEQHLCGSCLDDLQNSGDLWSCENCGTMMTEQVAVRVDGEVWCTECSQGLSYCDSCGEYHGHANEDDERPINYYTYRPQLHLYRATSDVSLPRSYGCELEIEITDGSSTRTVASRLLRETNIFYCKEDSSIDYGFEIVSHPFTYNYMMSVLGRQEFAALSNIPAMNGFERGTCGHHVHVGRETLTPSTLYRAQHIFEKNRPVILALARRTSGNLNDWSAIRDTNEETKRHLSEYTGGNRGALNLSNSATVEVRIFRGTTSLPAIIANVQAVKLLLSAADDLNDDEARAGRGPLLRYMETRLADHPEFTAIHWARLQTLRGE
jgi:hypothetical protein